MQVKVGLREREGLTSESRFRALGRPLWWVALGVLVTNDWVLKGSGLLPGWVTGKLSDFAGLIVAPVLLSAALGARRTATRALCFGAIAGVFAAIKLFAPAARLVESLMTALGVPWRIWVDPSDLIALAAIPVAWWIASPFALILESSFARAQEELRESLYSQMDPPKPTPPREPPASRFGLGMMLGAGVGRSLEINGANSESEQGDRVNGGLTATFDQRITRGFSLGIAGRIASWNTTRTMDMSYSRVFYEADLVPRLRHKLHGIAEGYIAFPFGLT
jgi:hypothetical protein